MSETAHPVKRSIWRRLLAAFVEDCPCKRNQADLERRFDELAESFRENFIGLSGKVETLELDNKSLAAEVERLREKISQTPEPEAPKNGRRARGWQEFKAAATAASGVTQ